VQGSFRNYNTLEGFKTADRPALLRECAARIWGDIRSGAAERDPSLLSRFMLLGHAELKSYRYYYWCNPPPPKHTDDPPSTLPLSSCCW